MASVNFINEKNTIIQMRKYARDQKINLHGKTRKSDILFLINQYIQSDNEYKQKLQKIDIVKKINPVNNKRKIELTKKDVEETNEMFDKINSNAVYPSTSIRNQLLQTNEEIYKQGLKKFKQLMKKVKDDEEKQDILIKQRNVMINRYRYNQQIIKNVVMSEQKKYIYEQLSNDRSQQNDQEFIGESQIISQDSFGGLVKRNYINQKINNLEQLYNEFQHIKNSKKIRFPYLQLHIQQDNKNRFITIKPQYLLTYISFIDRLTTISSGMQHGSDAMDLTSDLIQVNHFSIMFKQRFYGKTKIDFKNLDKKSIFICKEYVNGDKGDCLQYAISQCKNIQDYEVEMFSGQQDLQFNSDQKIILQKYNIVFVTNDLSTLKQCLQYRQYNELLDKIYIDEKFNLIYVDKDQQHAEYIIDLRLYIDDQMNIVNNKGETVMKYVDINKQNIKFWSKDCMLNGQLAEEVKADSDNLLIRDVKQELIIYDTETIFDIQTFQIKPILLQYYKLTLDAGMDEKQYMIVLEQDHYEYEKEKKNTDKLGYFEGLDCVKQFIEYIKGIQSQSQLTFCAYNGCSFDNFLLYEELRKQDMINNQDVVIANNQILQMKINGRHRVHDLCKILMQPLSTSCESFSCQFSKKSQKNYFQIIQNNIMNGKEWDDMDVNIYNDFIEYGIYDVLALAELYIKLQTTMNEIGGKYKDVYIKQQEKKSKKDKNYNEVIQQFIQPITSILTIGGYTYGIMNLIKEEQDFTGVTIDEYRFIKKAQIAGRTQCFIKGKTEEKYIVVDVCSLYPYVCLERQYPCGNRIHNAKFDKDSEMIGFFMITNVDQSMLKRKILPYRDNENMLLNWQYEDLIMNIVVDTVTMKQLIKYNVKFDIIDCEDNFYFDSLIDGKDLFRVLQVGKQLKSEQDVYKEKKDKKYNGAIRSFAKLIINCISGKVTEGLHCEQTQIVQNEKQVIDILQKYDDVVYQQSINNERVISYTKKDEDVNEQMQRPIYLGNMIYSYARSYMYDTCIHDSDSIANMDTDSSFINYADYKKFIMRYPQLQVHSCVKKTLSDNDYQEFVKFYPNIMNQTEKRFGDFEVEVVYDVGYYLQKKQYMCFNKIINQNGDIELKKVKGGFKGVKCTNDYQGRYYTKNELMQYSIDGQDVFKFKNDKCCVNQKVDKIKLNYLLWDLYMNENHKIEKQMINFIDDQMNGRVSYIIVGSIQKQIKGTSSKNCMSLYQQIMMKNIDSKIEQISN